MLDVLAGTLVGGLGGLGFCGGGFLIGTECTSMPNDDQERYDRCNKIADITFVLDKWQQKTKKISKKNKKN